MEDAPTSLKKINELHKGIIEKKEYSLNFFDDKYTLLMERDLYYIYFKLYKQNEISLYFYKNKFNLDNIANNLLLNPNIYNNIEKIFKFIDDNYSNNKIFININYNIVDLIIKITKDSKEYETQIKLLKSDLDINETFKALNNEIKIIKKNKNNLLDDRLFGVELLLNDIQNDTNIRLNKEKKEIDSFEKKISNSINEINENMEEINILKEKINNFKKQKENLINIQKNRK